MADVDEGTAAAEASDRVQQAFGDAAQTMKATGDKISQAGSDLGTKLLDQAEANTREAFKAMRDAAAARDLSDVIRIQSEYLREQGGRSMAQAREVGELIAGFGREAIGSMSGRKG